MGSFGSVASVTIGNPGSQGILVEDLRITFNCKKTQSSSDPNTCEVEIYNLNADRRNRIDNIDDICILQAGYSEASGKEIIFQGDITEVKSTRDRPDVITMINIGDGQKFITENIQSLSFGSGSTVRQILKQVVENSKDIIKSNLDLIDFTDQQYTHGFNYAGSTKNVLNNERRL